MLVYDFDRKILGARFRFSLDFGFWACAFQLNLWPREVQILAADLGPFHVCFAWRAYK